MKKIINLIFVGIICMLFTSCKNQSHKTVASANDVYGLGAVSTVNLLNHCIEDTDSVLLAVEEQSNPTKEIIDKFQTYFESLDCFLSEDVISTSTEENKDTNYPYEKKMTTKGKDMLGNDIFHTMYYTEQFIKEETDEDEKKQIFSLTGILLSDQKEFHLTGERETEISSDEHEDEIKIRAFADIDNPNTYVEMEQGYSFEQDEIEKEYIYRVVVDGKRIEETSVEFERETKGKEEIEYELEFLNGTGKGKYSIESVTINQKTIIEVKYNLSGNQGSFYVEKKIDLEGNVTYEYKVGNSIYIYNSISG